MASPTPRFSIDTSATTPTSPTFPRSGYPFPDSLHRQNTANRYAPRRGSSASTLSLQSIGGSLDVNSNHRRTSSSVRETSQNAISTLLQPPITRTGLPQHNAPPPGYRAPTTRDIPPVTLTNIPHVPPENFRDYLTRIGPLFESFKRGRIEPEQPAWLKKDTELEKTDRFAEALERRFSRDGSVSPATPRQPSSATLSPTPETPGGPGGHKRKTSANIRRNRNEPTPLSTIPSVYFDEDFHLENPRTFDVVSERAEIVRPPLGQSSPDPKAANGAPHPPRKALATNAILQEKLSWYMDTVEVHLINSISTASTGFFAALGSLKELQTEAEESVAKIQSLREDLRKLDREVAVGGLEVAAKRRRRANVRKLAKATAQVERVVEEVKRADELVDEGCYDEAADQMDRIGRLVCGRAEPGSGGEDGDLMDLRPLKALQGLDAGLQELQYRIGAGFAQRFTSILMDDVRQHGERVPKSDTLKRWSRQRGIPPLYMETNDPFRQDLLAALKGLNRAGYTAAATTAYRDAVQREMKAIIRKHLPSSSDDDADSMVSTSTRGGGKLSQQEKSTILARNLRAMDAEDAEKLLVHIYTAIGEALRRISTQTKVLLDVTSSMQPASTPTPPNGSAHPNNDVQQDELSQALDLSSLLGQAVDSAQTQLTKILKVRNEQAVRLSPERFVRYFTLNRLFADECEAVSGRGGQALKGLVNAQVSGFVQVLGTAESERIAGLLDRDDWNAKDFGTNDEKLLQRVLGGMSKDPVEWGRSVRPVWEEVGGAVEEAVVGVNGEGKGKGMNAKPAHIDETRYILVASAIGLLPTIDSFLALTTHLGPSMTPALATALLDVLRTFNSRSSQLVLGAGATRVSGLKNITTKHLALASQALSFVVALVPYVRECVRRHLPAASGGGGGGGVLAEFDKTKRSFQDHQSQIHDKLVEIMTTRSAIHVKTLLSGPTVLPNGAEVSPYMDTLTRETQTLHRVLARHLAEFDVSLIMRRIFDAYREQWVKAFGEVVVGSEEAGRRLVRDAEVFEARVGRIEGGEGLGREIVELVKGRVRKGG
ncbi:hypothetical protein BAUCODRAFT_112465 [Baudoinia panamericana UAMH 10762]|uniref:Vacuolar protein sorting-associated protein 54 n=1 Tax=Baudoinia panamericana (strain UAMH 10762) TaxID=717646 RepID=M2LI99_BAUPA|nr:uncharacterized protein BAUCODRAFT_112465 [Baudoinia panamericana UAMH 10762]EMC93892.1 hypothetical protein BAUCODRAFT_112465 [Baudoinia panamericana UAMH 10762]